MQDIGGISTSDFDESAQSAFAESVGSSIDGVDANDVKVDSVTDIGGPISPSKNTNKEKDKAVTDTPGVKKCCLLYMSQYKKWVIRVPMMRLSS